MEVRDREIPLYVAKNNFPFLIEKTTSKTKKNAIRKETENGDEEEDEDHDGEDHDKVNFDITGDNTKQCNDLFPLYAKLTSLKLTLRIRSFFKCLEN